MQKCANLVDLEKCWTTRIFLQTSASIQPRTRLPNICKISPNVVKFVAKFVKFTNSGGPGGRTFEASRPGLRFATAGELRAAGELAPGERSVRAPPKSPARGPRKEEKISKQLLGKISNIFANDLYSFLKMNTRYLVIAVYTRFLIFA